MGSPAWPGMTPDGLHRDTGAYVLLPSKRSSRRRDSVSRHWWMRGIILPFTDTNKWAMRVGTDFLHCYYPCMRPIPRTVSRTWVSVRKVAVSWSTDRSKQRNLQKTPLYIAVRSQTDFRHLGIIQTTSQLGQYRDLLRNAKGQIGVQEGIDR